MIDLVNNGAVSGDDFQGKDFVAEEPVHLNGKNNAAPGGGTSTGASTQNDGTETSAVPNGEDCVHPVENQEEHNRNHEPESDAARERNKRFRKVYSREHYIIGSQGIEQVSYGTDKYGNEEEYRTPVLDVWLDVVKRIIIRDVPDRLSQPARDRDVAFLTQFADPACVRGGDFGCPVNASDIQEVVVYRYDMTSRQPQCVRSLSGIKVPHHPNKRQTLFEVIEALGLHAPRDIRYNATGLVQTDQGLVFLNPQGGAITPTGLDKSLQTQLPPQVESRLTTLPYGWVRPSAPEELQQDYLTMLKLREIAPGNPVYGYLLLALPAFAPCSQACETGGLWAIIYGPTGSLKSATSRVPTSAFAYGFDGRTETSTVTLRDNNSTPYGVEQTLYYLAGMFAHCDDGMKGRNVTKQDENKFFKMISTIGSHAVTKQGAKRGTWGQGEGGFALEPYPRGSGVFTCEALPESESHASDLARFLVVQLDSPDLIDQELLSELQGKESAERMNRITCAYIQWLLTHMNPFLASIERREAHYRNLKIHTRMCTTYAKAEAAIALFLKFGVDIGVLEEQQAREIVEQCRANLSALAEKQAAMMGIVNRKSQENDPVMLFYHFLREALRTGKLYASDSAYRVVEGYSGKEGRASIIGKRPQPPMFLAHMPDGERDGDGAGIADMPDVWGWKWNESQRVYDPCGAEAGVLKLDIATERLTLHIYTQDFKQYVYPTIVKLASSQDIRLPGVSDMIGALQKRGKLTRTTTTHLHGRGSRAGCSYILDMTPEEEEEQEEEAPEAGTKVLPSAPAPGPVHIPTPVAPGPVHIPTPVAPGLPVLQEEPEVLQGEPEYFLGEPEVLQGEPEDSDSAFLQSLPIYDSEGNEIVLAPIQGQGQGQEQEQEQGQGQEQEQVPVSFESDPIAVPPKQAPVERLTSPREVTSAELDRHIPRQFVMGSREWEELVASVGYREALAQWKQVRKQKRAELEWLPRQDGGYHA